MGRLDGKAIVVVGGTTGLGLSAASRFVREGARVVALGLDDAGAAGARDALGPGARVLTLDARNPQTAAVAIELARREFGGFHGLYHVAGGSGRRQGDGPLAEITDAGWAFTLELNLTSVFYSNRAATRAFLETGQGGTVLNLGSVLAASPAAEFFSTQAYAAAKAALEGLTRSAAATYAARGIRFNLLAPGLIATPMSRRAQEDPCIVEYLRTRQPLAGGRLGQPEDLEGAAVFFLADESRFVTGQVLAVDGGWGVTG